MARWFLGSKSRKTGPPEPPVQGPGDRRLLASTAQPRGNLNLEPDVLRKASGGPVVASAAAEPPPNNGTQCRCYDASGVRRGSRRRVPFRSRYESPVRDRMTNDTANLAA